MELYTAIFTYVSGMTAENEKLYKEFSDLLKKQVDKLYKKAAPLHDEELLRFFRQSWHDWVLSNKVLNNIMAYLNRTWIKNQKQNNADVYDIHMLADVIWRDHMFMPLKDRLTAALLDLIRKERTGDKILDDLVKETIQCYVRLGLNKENPKESTLEIYKTHFEDDFLNETEIFYTIESTDFINQNGVPLYMRRVQDRLTQEDARVRNYLHLSTQDLLVARLEQVLISKHKEALQGKFKDLLEEDKIEDLTLMYALLSRIPDGLEPLKEILERHITGVGLAEVQNDAEEAADKPQVFVNILLRVFRKYSELIRIAFKNDGGFVASLDKACRVFVNENAVTKGGEGPKTPGKKQIQVAKTPQILSKYCDLILKKGPTHISDEAQMDATLNDIVSLFKYLPDKDVFMMVYSKLLSRRLINDQSASEDAEGSMISKLKSAQGFEYCMKLQRMIQDMAVSKDINTQFQADCESQGVKLPVAFSIFVLATGSWPLQAPQTPFNLPQQVEPLIENFLKFYNKKYQGRKLTYLHQLSRADVDDRAVRGKLYKLSVTTYQMAILLHLNDQTQVTLQQITDANGLRDEPLKTALLGLLKTKVMTCDQGEDHGEWTGETKFAANPKLKSKRTKINCNVPVTGVKGGEGGGGASITNQEVEQDRVFKLRAAVVRIMKARKTMTHNELISETTSQVTRWFTPRVETIKKVIEYLIDQEYIRRANDGKVSKYEYLA